MYISSLMKELKQKYILFHESLVTTRLMRRDINGIALYGYKDKATFVEIAPT